MPPDARVVARKDLEKEQAEYRASLRQRLKAKEITEKEYNTVDATLRDPGRFATLRNYDAIETSPGGYHILLNRSILAVQDGDVTGGAQS